MGTQRLFKVFRIHSMIRTRMQDYGVDLTYFLLCKMKRSLDVLPTLLTLLVSVVLEFDHLVKIVGAALLFNVFLDELREP